MWQVFSLLGLLSNSIENVVDKKALVKVKSIDSVVATFVRVFFYVLLTSLVGYLMVGNISLIFYPSIILFGLVSALNSFLYTYALKRIEVTNIGIISYAGPLLFLFIDSFILNTHFSFSQIAGVLLLVIGGVAFSFDGSTYKFKREISPRVWLIFIFWFIYGGVEAYMFKFFNQEYGINSVSFFVSVWMFACLFLFAAVLIQRKLPALSYSKLKGFLGATIVGKTFDAASSLFTAQALILASVSQVRSMEALAPLALLCVTFLVQGVFKISVEERMDRKNLIWKSVFMVVLISGGLLIK